MQLSLFDLTDVVPPATASNVQLRKPWAAPDVSALFARYPTAEPVRDIASLLGRSPGSVRSKARRLGLRRPKRNAAPLPALPTKPLPKPYRLTPIGGREVTWSRSLTDRLVRLWVANFHHLTISKVLGVGPRAASSKATRISLPPRGSNVVLSRNLDEAFRLDARGGDVPKTIQIPDGRAFVGKFCNLTGLWFYAPRGSGTHTSAQAKDSLFYKHRISAGA